MTSRRLFLPHIRLMTIRAAARLLKLRQLFFDSRDLRIGRFLVVLVTGNARGDRHIRGQTAQRAGSRNINVARRALAYVLTFAAFMTEHCRDALRLRHGHECRSGLVTTRTVGALGLLVFPMAIEAGVMSVRHRFEEVVRLRSGIGRAREGRSDDAIPLMADRAVVVVGFLLIVGLCRKK